MFLDRINSVDYGYQHNFSLKAFNKSKYEILGDFFPKTEVKVVVLCFSSHSCLHLSVLHFGKHTSDRQLHILYLIL